MPEQRGDTVAVGHRHASPLQGEDVVRESGVPFAVVRPTALTEEDAGAEVVVDQGDVLKVGIAADLAPMVDLRGWRLSWLLCNPVAIR